MGNFPPVHFLIIGENPTMDDFRTRIDKRIEEMGMTRHAIEVKNGFVLGYFRDILSRDRAPGFKKIVEICKALESTPDELFPEIEALYSARQIDFIRKTTKADREIAKLERELKS